MVVKKLLSSNMRPVILKKPSGTISVVDNLTSKQKKIYDVLLFVAREELLRNPSASKFEISLRDIKKFFGVKDKNNKRYKKIITDLVKTSIEYNVFHKDRVVEGVFSALPWAEVELDRDAGVLAVRFSLPEMVKEAMLNQEGIYAAIDLVVVKGLKSKYSLKLYELIRDYRGAQIPEMTMEKFREIFGIQNKYREMVNLRLRVLDPACKELNENPHVEYTVSYTLIKHGKAYTHIKFHVTPKKEHEQKNYTREKALELLKLLSLVPPEYRTRSTEKLLQEFVELKGKEYVEDQVKYTNRAETTQYVAYLKSALENDYAGFEPSEVAKEQEEKELKKYIGKEFWSDVYRNRKAKITNISVKGRKIFVEIVEENQVKVLKFDSIDNFNNFVVRFLC